MEYEKCLVELDEILNLLSYKDLMKIPDEIRKSIHQNKDKEYKWNYDKNKDLSEQNIDRETIAMLSYLNTEYLLDENQKNMIKNLHDFNEKKVEKEKSEKYNPNEIFKENKSDKKNYVMLIEVESNKWYEKIFNFFRNIFKKH